MCEHDKSIEAETVDIKISSLTDQLQNFYIFLLKFFHKLKYKKERKIYLSVFFLL